ncbi:MAG: 60S ribosomal protein L22 [Candidatus Bathyarchaeota archaeon]|nr:60S ribosomal protein L22 [Candidatus Bathyarchaeota archaeon]
MTEIKINISELKSEGEDVVKELADFIKEKTNAEVDTATDFITVKGEEGKVSKKYLRVLLKKFLHQIELKEYFRVISHESSLMVKEKKIEEE